MEWQPIETAPKDDTVIVGDLPLDTTAVAHWRNGRWSLGPQDATYYHLMDFAPAWWLPKDYPANPFKAALPKA